MPLVENLIGLAEDASAAAAAANREDNHEEAMVQYNHAATFMEAAAKNTDDTAESSRRYLRAAYWAREGGSQKHAIICIDKCLAKPAIDILPEAQALERLIKSVSR